MDGDAAAIIGRDDERASIERALEGPRPVAVIVEGEAGIGKTTLWSFALDLARGRGERVVAWRASSAERELAFGALMGLLDGLDGRHSTRSTSRGAGHSSSLSAASSPRAGHPNPASSASPCST